MLRFTVEVRAPWQCRGKLRKSALSNSQTYSFPIPLEKPFDSLPTLVPHPSFSTLFSCLCTALLWQLMLGAARPLLSQPDHGCVQDLTTKMYLWYPINRYIFVVMPKGENRMAPRKIYAGPYEARQLENGRWQVWYVEWTWPTLEQVEEDRKHNQKSSHPKPESYWEHQREL